MASPDLRDIDTVLRNWRQGDCVVDPQWFVFRADPALPFTYDDMQTPSDGLELVEGEVPGFAVLSQTCDLVSPRAKRPFVEVAALTAVDHDKWRNISRGRLPRYALVPSLEAPRLVADLDRVMTVEKAVVAGWTRVRGCRSDEEARNFARSLARKRSRFAFPDEFVEVVRPLRDWLISKHDKDSAEGRALRSLREIRVAADPSWDAAEVKLTFYFITNVDVSGFEGKSWSDLTESWLDRLKKARRFQQIHGGVTTLGGLTAQDYVDSDPLDLDHLSHRPA